MSPFVSSTTKRAFTISAASIVLASASSIASSKRSGPFGDAAAPGGATSANVRSPGVCCIHRRIVRAVGRGRGSEISANPRVAAYFRPGMRVRRAPLWIRVIECGL